MSLNKMIDHTLLAANATREQIARLCDEAAEHGFASVCVNSCWVGECASRLAETDVNVCTVIGFPLGAMSTAGKAAEAEAAVSDGANELDMVINVGWLLAGEDDLVRRDIEAVVAAAQGRCVKVIIETCLLSDEKIDPSRICVYRDASQFINEYVGAMREAGSAADALRRNYEDIDVLIIDDVQGLAGKAGTITFFFNIFNTLKSNGKQVVIAADRTPAELGMGKDGFDERVTSRIGGGFTVSVQVPSYELKLRLIGTFCDRMREDSAREHVGEPLPEIPERLQGLMAERAGTNIRTIEGFCQKCLITAAMCRKQGRELTEDDVRTIAKESWPENARGVTIENVQKYVEKVYDVSHEDLVGPKRVKEIMMTRHVAIWLCRELCNRTLADIGKKFGGRSHATIKHSIHTVEELAKDDKVFFDQLQRMKEGITSEA